MKVLLYWKLSKEPTKLDQELKAYLDEMKRELRADIEKLESTFTAKLDRAAQSFAVDIGHVHSEIRALLDRVKKIDSNVTTGVEMLVRQSRWHDETDSSAVELLVRVNALEKRLHELEHRS